MKEGEKGRESENAEKERREVSKGERMGRRKSDNGNEE